MTTKITEKNISSIANRFVSWQSVKTSGFTAVAGQGYFCNTTSTAFTVTLPTTAIAGDTITIKDYAGTFATNKLTIDRNGHNIQGVANNSLIGTNRAAITLVYIDVTRGWEYVKESNVADLQAATFISATGGTVTTSGNYKIHTFTGDGSFVVSSLGNPAAGPSGSNVDYLVVAGGGSGGAAGNTVSAGGGGAGGYRTSFPSPGCNAGSFPISATTYPITIGAGGAAAPGGTFNNGSPSIFSTVTSAGGGGGASLFTNAGSGGSGGGARNPGNSAKGSGNTPPVSPPQGNNGGEGATSGPGVLGGAGGGAAAVGVNATPTLAGVGGAGSANLITGSNLTYAGGGGGKVECGAGPGGQPGPGGTGGGGAGAPPSSSTGTNGTDNTGGGGGGGHNSGGKGIVIIRYKFQ